MSTKIVGWEGICYVPGEGKREPSGEIIIMAAHTKNTRTTPEEAWEDAVALSEKHGVEWIAIRPITEEMAPTSRARKLVTFAVYTTEVRESE